MFKVCSSLLFLITCVACGSSFTAAEDSGGSGSGQAGDESGGQPSSAGSPSGGDAGETDMGGTSSGGDGGSLAGSAGAGMSAGNGGAAAAGSSGSAGSGGAADCAKIKQDYQAALDKARVCDKGSTDQCSASSTVDPLSCGCSVLVNAKSEYTTAAKKARQAYRDAKCVEGVVCSAIACMQVSDASCAPSLGTGTSFVCTAVTAIAN